MATTIRESVRMIGESARAIVRNHLLAAVERLGHLAQWGRRVRRVGASDCRLPSRDHAASRKTLGEQGEDAAARYLRRKGMTIVRRSTRDRLGEIDLIAVHRRTVVFVEVKTRRSDRDGDPARAVDQRKQQRLIRAATYFISKHDLHDQRTRFDVVSIVWPSEQVKPQIKHYPNAFQPID